MPIRPPDRLIARLLVAGVLLVSLASCARRGACTGDYCGTVVIAAAGEPDILLPPVPEVDPRCTDARLAHRRVPVPAAPPRDVLRRGIPDAHPAGAPAPDYSAGPVA